MAENYYHIPDVEFLKVVKDSSGNKQYIVRGIAQNTSRMSDFHFHSTGWDVTSRVEADGTLTVKAYRRVT